MENISKSLKLMIFALSAALVSLLSQVSSYLINRTLAIGETWELNSFVWFTHIRNHGGIFGSFQGQKVFFAIFTLLILIALTIYLIKAKPLSLYNYICLGLITGGGMSNVLDRLIYGSVVDFINIQHIPYWHYIFNTADVMIHLGIWPLLLFSLSDQSGNLFGQVSKEQTLSQK